MAIKKQRLGINSTITLVKSIGTLSDTPIIPVGVVLRSDAERTIWEQFTSTRAVGDWRDFDLLIVAKAVRLEADIRKHQLTLDAMGVTAVNDRGTVVMNPMVTVIDGMQRQQLALIRSLSINQQASDPRTLNAGGTARLAHKKTMNDVDDLIAR